jgi:hypothetical protein
MKLNNGRPHGTHVVGESISFCTRWQISNQIDDSDFVPDSIQSNVKFRFCTWENNQTTVSHTLPDTLPE